MVGDLYSYIFKFIYKYTIEIFFNPSLFRLKKCLPDYLVYL